MAKANVELDGQPFLENVPATALLTLESRLKEVRQVLNEALTLESGKGWEKDLTKENVWVSPASVSVKTQKNEKPLIVVPATKEHPAQAKTVMVDEVVGEWKTIEISGRITSIAKMEMLERVDRLLEAVKIARAKANATEVVKVGCAKKIFDYIMG